MDNKSRVYIKIDDENRIVQIEGEYSLASLNLDECILIEEGEPCDRLNLAQSLYLPKPLFSRDGIAQYKYEDGNIIERTEEEMEADKELIEVDTAPTIEERVTAMEDVVMEMLGGSEE